MRNLVKVNRLLQLHDALLKMKELEQKQRAEDLREAERDLSAAVALLEAADRAANTCLLTGGEALQWNLYLQLLEDKRMLQEQRAIESRERFETSRANTIAAYQEKEKWQLQNDRLRAQAEKEWLAKDTKSADDLALQRFAGQGHQRES